MCFFNLAKNHGLGECFGNSWRCSKGISHGKSVIGGPLTSLGWTHLKLYYKNVFISISCLVAGIDLSIFFGWMNLDR